MPFTAVATCPSCHRTDVHKMRSPKPAPTAAEIADWERNHETQRIRRWGDNRTMRVIHVPPRPVDESVFEVIRVCRCGHEWGMA